MKPGAGERIGGWSDTVSTRLDGEFKADAGIQCGDEEFNSLMERCSHWNRCAGQTTHQRTLRMKIPFGGRQDVVITHSALRYHQPMNQPPPRTFHYAQTHTHPAGRLCERYSRIGTQRKCLIAQFCNQSAAFDHPCSQPGKQSVTVIGSQRGNQRMSPPSG